MVQHRLDPEPGTVTDFLSPDRRSVLSVAPGETVVVRTLDAHDYLDRQRTPGETRPLMFPDRRGHCLAGLIAVHGAQPGMMLAIRLDALRPDDWGWTGRGPR